MKVAVYAIAKNESKHVARWLTSSLKADYHLIADTGSTDDTVAIAKSLGINVIEIKVEPWRFDTARNLSLDALPDDIDYCIALDMDEVLTPGWREQLEIAHSEGIERPQYRFITSWDEKGKPLTELDGFRIHKRHGMTWVHPIHEVLRCVEGEDKHKVYPFEIHHLPDHSKPRDYLKQLEAAVKEEPNSRNLYYLAREYFGHSKLDKAQKVIKRYLKVSEFAAEKSYALRMLAKCEAHKQEHWLLESLEVYPSRESVLALANYYYTQQRWAECNYVAKRALSFKERSTEFLSENWAWGHMGYDLVAVSAWKLGNYQEAFEYGQQAVQISPDDDILKNNLKSYQEKINAEPK